MAKITDKEIVLRQWFASRYGNRFENHVGWSLPKNIAALEREYTRDNPQLRLSFNFVMYKLREVENEVRQTGMFNLHADQMRTQYLDENYVRPADSEGPVVGAVPVMEVAAPVVVEVRAERLDDMEYPPYRKFATGTLFDRIASDFDDEGGLYGGTVIICTGESGVGKSTLLIALMSRLEDRGVKTLYVSSEMTKTDLFFYKAKMPGIGKLRTVLVADYLKQGLKEALTQSFLEIEADVVLLDSYQDSVEKLADILNWRHKEAENFLIGLMIDAAEKLGKCVIAIQHLTKGGTYVGSTYLKHTTQAMLELRFDKQGLRYAEFSKNRRGGSMMNRPVYFTLKAGEIGFDEDKFSQHGQAERAAQEQSEKAQEARELFEAVFKNQRDDGTRNQMTYHDDEDE